MDTPYSSLWTAPPPQPPRRRRGLALGIGLLIGGAAGAVIATALGANAATTANSNGAPAALYASGSAAVPAPEHGPGSHGLDNTGTVTAVGSNSVTIRTSTGTTTYGVTSSSDIDKNGEAQLSDLKVGDAVRFSTETVNGQTVIDKLHAGDEAKDAPTGPRPGATYGG